VGTKHVVHAVLAGYIGQQTKVGGRQKKPADWVDRVSQDDKPADDQEGKVQGVMNRHHHHAGTDLDHEQSGED
jgi:hypothetical protein